MLKAERIVKSYGKLKVLKSIDLVIDQGRIVSIVGASGAGKSTLLHILGTLDKPDEGRVWLGDIELSKLKGNDLALYRNQNIGFIFQFHNLMPEFTALENVCIPGYLAGKKSDREIVSRGRELLNLLGLKERLDHKPNEMSGGEQQRTAVARALMNNPAVVFADEPSGNLDSHTAEELHQLFFRLRDEIGQTFVIVTHNEELADMADEKFEIKDGVIFTE
ncbi:lipoprotein-releasing system ATP-binding protein [Catalinimonas alkaloidigena]|uniref:ABC transporter ATP-binding protein n=1 Tax=Catalinimonas alkaloidigena TaxID=1075417 RepID=UPI0024057E8E|nr:ABC transporter ATP-binding protein [Catalinimonas alkaloidigena]MDF9796710.1 lipoprotein-releasing system ATP-binding protein [Catalinimonas alkaloidigena]